MVRMIVCTLMQVGSKVGSIRIFDDEKFYEIVVILRSSI